MSSVSITKTLEDKNLVFGWANVSIRKSGEQVEDFHEDMIDPADLEQAAYLFVKEYRDANVEHQGPVIGTLVECIAITKEKLVAMGLAEDAMPQGIWVGFEVSSETFAKVKNKELEMFSIEGTALPEEV